jgi:hypothetical protein
LFFFNEGERKVEHRVKILTYDYSNPKFVASFNASSENATKITTKKKNILVAIRI